MASGGMSAMFKSSAAVKAVITLVLIENSQEMYSAWPELRDHYLPTLLGTMRVANPVVPIPVLWLTTTPAGEDSTSLQSAPPRQYNQLPELKFAFHPDNRITSRIISRAIELMLEAKAPFQGLVNLHLIIVAASTPIQTSWCTPTMPSESGSEWQVLGQKLAQNGIYCHMVLHSSQDMHALQELYMTNLQLQGHEAVAPWFASTPTYTFYLSADPSNRIPLLAEDKGQGFSPPTRPPVLRHQSFPQDARSGSSETSASLQMTSTPSLVSSLQKVHGLSRKKLYGTQPVRQPFVREEPVRAKYRQAPTPLSIPVGPLSTSAEDGHVVSKNKPERTRRSEKLTHSGGLSDMIPTGRRSPWKRSKMSSPDLGSLPSSPSSHMSHARRSPTMPLYPEHSGFPASPPATSTSFSSDMMSSSSMTDASYPITPSSGADLSLGYFAASSPQQAPSSALVPVSPQGSAWTYSAEPVDSTVRRRSHDFASAQNLSSMSEKYRMDGGMPVSSDQSRGGSRNTMPKVKDAGDVPFIFSPELEAATAAKLKAALESTNSPLSTFTSMNNYTTDGACASEILVPLNSHHQ
ncbi:hypothetical protein F5I97DRAFT_1926913 [Phlebopus sp. FC_14]|nr:hypothetical protein F5I97DRAFT_1926913 [Phlebopus sp. FC_14]